MVALCREKGWVHDLQPDAVDAHAFDEGITQTGKTPTRQVYSSKKMMSPDESPSKKRKVMGEVSANAREQKRVDGSPKVPGKVITAGKRGVLDGRPVLKDIYNGAM
jgi:DNA replication ATP-dependent helicase Dna2